MSLIPRAIDLAFEIHAAHEHVEGGPFVAHPLRVLALLRQYRPLGETPLKRYEELGCIALLHDAIGTGGITEAELKETFGAFVADGVRSLTRPAGSHATSEAIRDEAYHIRLRTAPLDVQIIKLVELLDDLRSLTGRPLSAEIEEFLREVARFYLPWAEAIAPELAAAIRTDLEAVRREKTERSESGHR